MSFVIEQAVLADAGEMAALHYLSHMKSFAAFASAQFVSSRKLETYVVLWNEFLSADEVNARAWVARSGSKVVGIVRVHPMPEPGLAQLGGMHVHPENQGRGIGRALMTAAELFLVEAGYDRCILGVVEANATARALYEKTGWRPFERHDVGVEGVPYWAYEKLYPRTS